jgi:hypothetical protein
MRTVDILANHTKHNPTPKEHFLKDDAWIKGVWQRWGRIDETHKSKIGANVRGGCGACRRATDARPLAQTKKDQ